MTGLDEQRRIYQHAIAQRGTAFTAAMATRCSSIDLNFHRLRRDFHRLFILFPHRPDIAIRVVLLQ